MEIRRVRVDEAERLREIRLRALQEAPAAFAATFAGERALPASTWTEWTAVGAAGESNVTIVAVEGDVWLGMVLGRLLAGGSAWLEALWVDPRARRAGLGSRLIEAVADWSRDRGARMLELSVTDNNDAAMALYVGCGFVETGRRRPLPSDPTRIEIFLGRRLS